MLSSQARAWSTPKASYSGPDYAKAERNSHGDSLVTQTAKWPTPDASVSTGYNQTDSPNAIVRPALGAMAAQWPTPAARDSKGANSAESQERRAEGREHNGQQLPNFVEHQWKTPRANEQGQWQLQKDGSQMLTLDGQSQSFPQDLQNSSDGEKSSESRRLLNPLFVEWLMNWPIGWTASDSAATAYSHWLQQSRSLYSRIVRSILNK